MCKGGRRLLAGVLAGLLLLGALAGCTPRRGARVGLRVVASFYPIYIMALNLTQGVDGVQLVNMAGQQAGCLHDYQLRSSDMQALEQADLFLTNGAGMESFLDKVTERLPNLRVLDSSAGVPPLQTDGEINPHMWVSISAYIRQVQNIAAGLQQADPAHAAAYRANAAAYEKKLSDLRARMHRALDSLPQRDIVTFHEAFPYFAQEFGLRIVQTVQREPDSQPSARELAQTIRLVRDSGVRAVFVEPQYQRSAADVIARESGAAVYTLDPAATGADSPDAYVNAMENNLLALRQALA